MSEIMSKVTRILAHENDTPCGRKVRVDVGLVGGVDVAIVSHYETGEVRRVVYTDLREALALARLVNEAVQLATKNRKESGA